MYKCVFSMHSTQIQIIQSFALELFFTGLLGFCSSKSFNLLKN